tara:strand:+ start:40 stop:315 length:276 start_codon:yes stop_codon:yes gene_type:complete
MKRASVAEIKSHFSEYISKVAYSQEKIIITKRNKPIAALIDMNELKKLNNVKEISGLSSVIGKWKNFHEISEEIDKAYRLRKRDKPRNVSI